MSWYLRSTKDHDTHRGTLSRGMVNTACRIRFRPRPVAFGRKALPGEPLDPRAGLPRMPGGVVKSAHSILDWHSHARRAFE